MVTIIKIIQKYWMYLLSALAVFFIWRWIKLPTKQGVSLEPLNINESLMTISDVQARRYADYLYSAMKGAMNKKSEIDRIYNLLALNFYDLAKVYNAFGIRKYQLFGEPLPIPFINEIGTFDYDLRQWLKASLSSREFLKWEMMFSLLGI